MTDENEASCAILWWVPSDVDGGWEVRLLMLLL